MWPTTLFSEKLPYLPLPTSSPPMPAEPGPSTSMPSRRRRRIAHVVVAGVVGLAAVSALVHYTQRGDVEVIDVRPGARVYVDEADPMWGVHEADGWAAQPYLGLADLGELADGRYRLNVDAGPRGAAAYFHRLAEFTFSLPAALHAPLLSSLYQHQPPGAVYVRRPAELRHAPTSMISYKTIHQTDKTAASVGAESRAWQALNAADGWAYNFLDDAAAQKWVDATFAASNVSWAWEYMHRGVLRADFLRYLLPLVEGGVYSDVDTRPLRPIEQWGHTRVEYLNLSTTDGEAWRTTLSTYPAVIVAIDVDVHAHPAWASGWPRPLGVCQWTLSSAPSHPIFLDAVRRVVNATHVVRDWEMWRAAEIKLLTAKGRQEEADELRGQGRDHAMNVMEWTGPGLFSDAVFAFLLARYNVTWHRLRGLDHPLRIGDVLVLPITGFSPGGEPDFRAEGPDSPQANVLHDFRGSWKGDGA
ncbi:hypothetical protein Q5752_004012 [Cryptotrichosporon argae]